VLNSPQVHPSSPNTLKSSGVMSQWDNELSLLTEFTGNEVGDLELSVVRLDLIIVDESVESRLLFDTFGLVCVLLPNVSILDGEILEEELEDLVDDGELEKAALVEGTFVVDANFVGASVLNGSPGAVDLTAGFTASKEDNEVLLLCVLCFVDNMLFVVVISEDP